MASASGGSTTRPIQGPFLPGRSGPSSDRQFDRELDAERLDRERRASRKRAREEDNEHVEDVIGPKAVGREGALEAKRAKRENDRAFREREAEDDFGDDFLMGGDSFKSRCIHKVKYVCNADVLLQARSTGRREAEARGKISNAAGRESGGDERENHDIAFKRPSYDGHVQGPRQGTLRIMYPVDCYQKYRPCVHRSLYDCLRAPPLT